MIPRVTLTDFRGRKYVYSVFDISQEWVGFPGNYVFARRTHRGWEPLYIGEADNLRDSVNRRHEAWAFCRSRGATHVLVHFNFAGRKARQAEEQALVIAYEPPGNCRGPAPGYVILPDITVPA
jgi:hypothetical protein